MKILWLLHYPEFSAALSKFFVSSSLYPSTHLLRLDKEQAYILVWITYY